MLGKTEQLKSWYRICQIRRGMDQEGKNWDKEGIPGSGRSMYGLHANLLQALKGSGFSEDVHF